MKRRFSEPSFKASFVGSSNFCPQRTDGLVWFTPVASSSRMPPSRPRASTRSRASCSLLLRLWGLRWGNRPYIARGGQIIDATIVSVPKQRNTKEENEAIKAGKTPEGWV